jgi:uncharacterized protein YlzI (FlbEa/FlbD family)
MFNFFTSSNFENEKKIVIESVIPKLEKKISQFSLVEASETTIDLVNEKKYILKAIKYYYNL